MTENADHMVESVLRARVAAVAAEQNTLISLGGFAAPAVFMEGYFEIVRHLEPRPWRWLNRLRGWPDYWEEVVWRAPLIELYGNRPVRDALPSFAAARGGIDFNREPEPLEPKRPPTPAEAIHDFRTALAKAIAPWVEERDEDDYWC